MSDFQQTKITRTKNIPQIIFGIFVLFLAYSFYSTPIKTNAEIDEALASPPPSLVPIEEINSYAIPNPVDEVNFSGFIGYYHYTSAANTTSAPNVVLLAYRSGLAINQQEPEAVVVIKGISLDDADSELFQNWWVGEVLVDKTCTVNCAVNIRGTVKTKTDISESLENQMKLDGYKFDSELFYVEPFLEGREAALEAQRITPFPIWAIIIATLFGIGLIIDGIGGGVVLSSINPSKLKR